MVHRGSIKCNSIGNIPMVFVMLNNWTKAIYSKLSPTSYLLLLHESYILILSICIHQFLHKMFCVHKR
jgi:hypothetical protein